MNAPYRTPVRQGRRRVRRVRKVSIPRIATGGFLVAASCGAFTALAGPALLLVPAIAIAGTATMASAWLGAYRERCPGCRAPMVQTDTEWWRTGRRCASCNRYVEGDDDALWLTAEGRVHDLAAYESPLPDAARFPETCSVCLAPATRLRTIEPTRLDEDAPSRRRTRIAVPHCDEHDDGAEAYVLIDGAAVIRFRSHAYWRAFCAENHTLDLPPPTPDMLLTD